MNTTDAPVTGDSSVEGILFGAEAQLPPFKAALLGFQHVMAMFVGTITPPLLLGGVLHLSATEIAYLINMALLVSAIASFIQIRGFGPFGSRLLSVQGTSFTFLEPLRQAGQVGGLPLMFGLILAAAPVGILLGPVIHRLRRFFPPVVTGTIVLLIGLSLIPAAMVAIRQGFGGKAPALASLGVAVLVGGITIFGGAMGKPWARTMSVLVALAVGYGIAAGSGWLRVPSETAWFALPEPLQAGLAFRWDFLGTFVALYLVTALETIGDITATAQLSGVATTGTPYWQRIKGGIMADGVNSLIAGFLGAFPNTTFAQNNGLIQITGVASRQVGYWMCGFLALFGLVPLVGGWMGAMPGPVLGGMTLVLFGYVAAGGIRILHRGHPGAREWTIVAASLGVGLGFASTPEVLDGLPLAVARTFHSSVVSGGLCAVFLQAFLPGRKITLEVESAADAPDECK